MRLLRTRHFYIGLGILAVLGLGVYWAVDAVLMPRVARHGVITSTPSVLGKPKAEALDALEAAGLVLGDTMRQLPFVDTLGADAVIYQRPLPGTVIKPGRRVTLVFNRSIVPTVRVPDVATESKRNARSALEAVGLYVLGFEPDSVPHPIEGPVTRSDPPAGTEVTRGDSVLVFYSTGLNFAVMVEVPDLVGMRLESAQETLRRRGLWWKVRNQTDDAQNPRIVHQTPDPGSTVAQGSEITLYAGPPLDP